MSCAPIALSNENLPRFAEHILRPNYDRSKLTAGIVHIGLGNFHRAHQAWYLHRLMQQGLAMDWAIIGAGVRASDAVMREKLLAQDCLTTLFELDPNGMSIEIIGSMIDFIPVDPHNGPLIAQMSDPAIRIVALTVTEGGYYTDAEGGLDLSHPDLVYDIAHPDAPCSVFGAIVAALRARRAAGAGPFTVQSCDNLQGNGDIVRQVILGLAQQIEAELADWIAAQVTFPNSMVDCIVPATGPAEITLAHEAGVLDAVPVTHESFRQWAIEDRFCAGRPDWEKAGATPTQEVHSYEAMKIRLLNAGHQLLANAGENLSIETIDGCMADPDIAAFFGKVTRQEIAPHVKTVPGMDPLAYIDVVAARFSNPKILDTTRRVSFDGSSRHAGFLLPVVRDALQALTPVSGLALAEALWARMCVGTREDGSQIEANDPQWDKLQSVALAAKDTPILWLQQTLIYGDLADHAEFSAAFARWLEVIWTKGSRAALRIFNSGS